ncbi:hypothetical protein DFH06DRAFT_1138516 [Mycena polygramma]|nr:hypothetical protein DFH06DRAFT_1138516 [Mycena polygramma]
MSDQSVSSASNSTLSHAQVSPPLISTVAGAHEAHDSPGKRHSRKGASSVSASTVIARRHAAANYRARQALFKGSSGCRNEEKLREKARERMARLRERRKAEEDLIHEVQCRAREASKKYRQTHAATLAHWQRCNADRGVAIGGLCDCPLNNDVLGLWGFYMM